VEWKLPAKGGGAEAAAKSNGEKRNGINGVL